eukprot:gb/GECG01011927.1/.p1 GENE.gb/GECG01011927.1/~~gb/GECG01011927.1/.p1  ORF type:complete len:1065 (+),score=115.64 gb/GECG01011927.1/:1-3195(+)
MLVTRARNSVGSVAARATKQHGKMRYPPLFQSSRVGSHRASNALFSKSVSTVGNDRSLVLADLARYVSEYRQHGHLVAQIDPLELYQPSQSIPQVLEGLDRNHFPVLHRALYQEQQDIRLTGEECQSIGIPKTMQPRCAGTVSVSDVLQHLKNAYGSSMSVEFSHCKTPAEREWWALHLEAANSSVFEPLTAEMEEKTARTLKQYEPTPAEKKNSHTLLTMAERFELFLARKFETLKRYSGEGAESMIPALETIFSSASKQGTTDAIIGMPHRGRLGFLVSLMEYPARKLFHKLKGRTDVPASVPGIDDVSSHVACTNDRNYGENKIHLSLLHNPSHLEAVNPVAMGKTRSKREAGSNAMCVLIHGDAAFSGQGVVAETFNMQNLPGYDIGGTIHLIVNNQLGFTAGHDKGRSGTYCSDVAKTSAAPILHVNGENIRDVILASKLAVAYRQRFGNDVVLDMVSWRKHGHNELDEPSFTQPEMYRAIKSRKSYPQRLTDELLSQGLLKEKSLESLHQKLDSYLDREMHAADNYDNTTGSMSELAFPGEPAEPGENSHGEFSCFRGKWKGIRWPNPEERSAGGVLPLAYLSDKSKAITLPKAYSSNLALVGEEQPSTGVDLEILKDVGRASVTTPEGFQLHQRLERQWKADRLNRLQLGGSEKKRKDIDWATGEILAFGSLLTEGRHVRLSGQDSERGTFSQRHAVLHDQEHSTAYVPLNHVRKDGEQGKLHAHSSHLSEFAVMGYEYGYSIDDPNSLPIWEAQFGDFSNGGQIAIDQFISSSETKWLRQTGLVLLLPHGYDGAGPEHSSCRVERYLQLCNSQQLSYNSSCFEYYLSQAGRESTSLWGADGSGIDKSLVEPANLQVVMPSTPAQYFHLLRRQMARPFRKPLVVVGPKTLLRHPQAVSPLQEFGPSTRFYPVLTDTETSKASESVERIIFCSGKLYYDLLAARESHESSEGQFKTAIVRIEELCPFPALEVMRELETYKNGKKAPKVIWAQEEPVNAGAWNWIRPHMVAPMMAAKYAKSIGAAEPEVFSRPALAASAVGTGTANKLQNDSLLDAIFH